MTAPIDSTARTEVRADAALSPRSSALRRLATFPAWGAALIGALLIAVVIAVANIAFLRPQNLSNIFAQTAVLAILASSQAIVMITAGIDLSVASVAALSASALGVMTVANDVPWFLALLACLALRALIGALRGFLIGRVTLPAFIVTLGGLIVMDESTAAPGVRETDKVEQLIARLRERGMSVLLVSHNMAQVKRITDRVLVLRRGRLVAGANTADVNAEDVVSLVTGAREGSLR